MTNVVLTSVNENGVASLILNRPEAINSLSTDMLEVIGEKLKEWEHDDQVRLVVLKGEGSKGFCAGGDIKTLYGAQNSSEALEKAERFFEKEYVVDQLIYQYSKPIIACLDGVVMGGGVGLTYGASHRIVTERTKWAMPEMNIGFFPDVGAAYFLNQAPGHMARYLALTASVIKAPDVLYIGGADAYMKSEKMDVFLSELEGINWHNKDVDAALNELTDKYTRSPEKEGQLHLIQEDVDQHFSYRTVEGIVHSLDNASSDFAKEAKEMLLSKSPSSLKVTLKQLMDGENKTIDECFHTDLILAKNFMRHEDFFEGVRSVLIDKDRNPQYKYPHLQDFSDEEVQKFFSPGGKISTFS
ncbi:enoyl-CoA hydratase/isomerase family protein [Halobacillus shinanisalinarum]|uniref:3-hydroxyisobutyryl-CoA hydrolase n=1 Tax=Halobacillus shinanisalinarum TaxID=2932258 RepID=A0ABY4GYA6_9BACI|nr:enoyl-CoA hydratase/isomerase family protein [Halobacillus shinanisalinarum]UOQ93148.1 enoyl-CoA hydratase/isomerase family protein [Halobacillus shinanisalinarum]